MTAADRRWLESVHEVTGAMLRGEPVQSRYIYKDEPPGRWDHRSEYRVTPKPEKTFGQILKDAIDALQLITQRLEASQLTER